MTPEQRDKAEELAQFYANEFDTATELAEYIANCLDINDYFDEDSEDDDLFEIAYQAFVQHHF